MPNDETRFIDTHVHFALEHLKDFYDSFDEISLCGAWNIVNRHRAEDDELVDLIRETRKLTGGAVRTLYWPDWQDVCENDKAVDCARDIERLHAEGIVGVKVWKDLGLGLKDPDGKLMMLDDERLNPVWEKMVALKLILVAHVADPAAFWLPLDESNPAYEALRQRPQWHFGKPGLPSRDELYEARNTLHKRFPSLVIVNSHCAGYVDTVDRLEKWMDDMPNFYASVGRSHVRQGGESFARFLRKHCDRVMFETDLGMRRGRPVDRAWNREMYRAATGFFEGVFMLFSDEAFEQFAHGNAERLIREATGT